MKVTIDQKSGFCFGVVNAIQMAESTLQKEEKLYCLGDIVHNGMEVGRLESIGLITIDREQFLKLSNCKVLLRAHGEPPSTYEFAEKNNIELIDATCPVVLKLQQRVKKAYTEMQKQDGQVVIFGKPGHAEVVALSGQTRDEAIVVESIVDLQQVDPSRPSYFFSQTTKSVDKFKQLADILKQQSPKGVQVKDTICRQVANRVPRLKAFSKEYQVILFVGGKKSSNAKFLFDICKQVNPNSYFISNVNEIEKEWFDGKGSVGVCGATSTPQWLMEDVAKVVSKI